MLCRNNNSAPVMLVLQAESKLAGQEGTTVIVCGDTPLISSETIVRLVEQHEQNRRPRPL